MSKAIFTHSDYEEVRKAMIELSEKEMKIIFLRFWGPYSIVEIGKRLGMSYDTVDQKLKAALRKLKKYCLSTPSFGRSISHKFSMPDFDLTSHVFEF